VVLVLAGRRRAATPVKPPTHRGFGTRVMDNMIRGQLKGEMRFDWRAEGLACQIVLPV
jgi:two-component sensor histidine kinase